MKCLDWLFFEIFFEIFLEIYYCCFCSLKSVIHPFSRLDSGLNVLVGILNAGSRTFIGERLSWLYIFGYFLKSIAVACVL